MNVSFEKNGNVSGVLTINIEKADYAEKVKKSLTNLRKGAQVPGFRPGHAPAGMIEKRFGAQVKMEEINKMLQDNLFKYIKDNNLNILGEPLGNEEQEPQDIEKADDFTFKFDIALAPEFSFEFTDKDTLPYYEIHMSQEQIDSEVNRLREQAGAPASFEEYQEKDIVRGQLVELENGAPKAEGLVVEKASLMPVYFADKEQAKLFEGAKKGGKVTFNLSKAYEGREAEVATILKIEKEEVAAHNGEFEFTIDDISRIVPAELNQEFFDRVFGEGKVTSEEEMLKHMEDEAAKQFAASSDYQFLLDVKKAVIEKVGAFEFDEKLIKRLILQADPDKSEEVVNQVYESTIDGTTWQVIRNHFAKSYDIKVEDADVRSAAINAARMQFAQYGMRNIPEEYLEQYAEGLLKDQKAVSSFIDQAVDTKLAEALKKVVQLEKKPISVEDFNKLS